MAHRLICLAFAILPVLACQAPEPAPAADPAAEAPPAAAESAANPSVAGNSEGLFEVRNYNFRPDLLADYRAWAENDAIPYLAQNLDVVGFWFGTDVPSEITGAPLDDLGSANVSWIIRWDDMEHRAEQMGVVFATEEWADIFSRVPGGPESYLRIESRFMEGADALR